MQLSGQSVYYLKEDRTGRGNVSLITLQNFPLRWFLVPATGCVSWNVTSSWTASTSFGTLWSLSICYCSTYPAQLTIPTTTGEISLTTSFWWVKLLGTDIWCANVIYITALQVRISPNQSSYKRNVTNGLCTPAYVLFYAGDSRLSVGCK